MTLRKNSIITIGMPVYNGADFIKEALDSLLAQTFIDFELIISDNASTDSTELICCDYIKKDSRIKYIRQTQNLGALQNFQFVLDEAVGEYFMWAACDDKWSEAWVLTLYEKLKQIQKSAVFGKLIQINEFSEPISHPATKNTFNFTGNALNRKFRFFLEYEGNGKANLFYSMFRTEELKHINLLQYEQDYYALFDWLNNMQFLPVNEAFLYKRIHSAGQGIVKHKSIFIKLINVLTLKTVLSRFNNALGYLKYSCGFEKLTMALLIPIKIFLDHISYLKHILINLQKH